MPNTTTKTPTKRPQVTKKRKTPAQSRRALRVAKIVGIIIAALLLVTTALLSWNHWLRFDDKADIQGTWVVEGTQANVTIDATSLKLTDDVSYAYELDTFNKTISFSYEQLSGSASYAFSPERDVIIITESGENNTESNAIRLVKQGSHG